MKINGLILAAGGSSRLGQDKQLVMFQGVTLIRHIEQTLQPLVSQLHVVLGHNHTTVLAELKSSKPVLNSHWQQGMGSSLACGVKAAINQADAILIALCDQPQIPLTHYQKMIHTAQQNPTQIIATGYAGISGVPVIFPKTHFDELVSQSGAHGAHKVIDKNPNKVLTLICDAAEFDVDNQSQVDQL